MGGVDLTDALYNNTRIIEYVDDTEYFDIETPSSPSGAIVNPRYWEEDSIKTGSDHGYPLSSMREFQLNTCQMFL